MRSLEDAGIGGQRPPFVRAKVIGDRPFSILNARINPSGYNGQPEMVATLRFLGRDSRGDAVVDADGHEIVECSWSASLTYQRQDIVNYFAVSHDPLGPCQFEFRSASRVGEDAYAHVTTYRGRLDPGYAVDGGGQADAPAVPSPSPRSDIARNFPNGGRSAAPGSAPARSPAAAGPRSALAGMRPTDDEPPEDFDVSADAELPF